MSMISVWLREPTQSLHVRVGRSRIDARMLTPKVSQISAGTAHPLKPKRI